MAAKLILVLAFGFLVTDAYRLITFTMKRDHEISTEGPKTKPLYSGASYSVIKGPPGRQDEIKGDEKKNLPENMDQNKLRPLDFWRTLFNYLEEQPVIILPEQDVEKQLENIQDLNSEYY